MTDAGSPEGSSFSEDEPVGDSCLGSEGAYETGDSEGVGRYAAVNRKCCNDLSARYQRGASGRERRTSH